MYLIIAITLILVVAFFYTRRKKMHELEMKDREELHRRTMPDGSLVPEDDVLLFELTNEQLLEFKEKHLLMWLINFVCYREIEASEEEKPLWRNLINRLTKIKTGAPLD